jgi:hypothetical protein
LKWVEKLRFASQLRETKLVRWVDSEELDVDHREGEKAITIMTANKIAGALVMTLAELFEELERREVRGSS